MLSALLGTVQTTLGTPGFLIASVFPVVLFAVVNGLLAARAWPAFAAWLTAFETLSEKTLLTVAVSAAALLASYVVSATASAFLEIYEGRRAPVSWFAAVLHRLQRARLRRLEDAYWACVHALGDLDEGGSTGWPESLRQARKTGRQQPHCAYGGIPEMATVQRERDAGRAIVPAVLASAVAKLRVFLSRNHASIEATATGAQRRLDEDCDRLIEAIHFSTNRYRAERVRLHNLRRFQFPASADADEDPTTILLAPTALGNIARTIRSYPGRHYQLDVDVLWTRLDQVLRTSEPFYKSLQDAKVQVDFFVACSWLGWVTTVVWLGLQVAVVRDPGDFLIVGVAGPLAAFSAYLLACRSYGVFADVMRTGIDLFRFKVLTDLHLPLPLGLEEEKVMWLSLSNRMGFENVTGADDRGVSVTYRHPG